MALLVSCERARERAVRELAGAGVSASGESLVAAVEGRDVRKTALLLEAGVYTGQRNAAGRTPLGIAVENRDLSSAFQLLNAGADVNALLDGKACILGAAVENGDAVMMEVLLAAGARTDGTMSDGERILPWAIREGRLGMVRTMMVSGADPHLKDRQGNPLLHVAMKSGRRDLTEMLIELGADCGGTNAAGESTMDHALRQGWVDIVPKLALAGADPNASGPDGRTPLERAVADDDAELAALFLKLGADPNLRLGPGSADTPMEAAFKKPDARLFGNFVRHGGGGALRDPGKWLWRALQERDREKLRVMLSNGARTTEKNSDGLSLVEAATMAREPGMVKLLLDYGFPAGRSLFIASSCGDSGIVELMLCSGVPADFTMFPGKNTALGEALRGRHDRTASLLLEHGADPGLSLPEGQSLFHLAVVSSCPRTVQRLLSAGADPNAKFAQPVSDEFRQRVRPGVLRWVLKNDGDVTPLMAAADSGCIQTARCLMKAGAKSNVFTRSTRIWPINFASRRNDVRMMRLFLGRDPLCEERIIEIRLSEQRARVMDAAGLELLSTKVSTGRKGYDTPTGEYVITNKYRDWNSTLYHASMPYFQRLSCGDFGLHQGYVPGHPASHGCIRVPSGVAAKLFAMTRTGDRVRILP